MTSMGTDESAWTWNSTPPVAALWIVWADVRDVDIRVAEKWSTCIPKDAACEAKLNGCDDDGRILVDGRKVVVVAHTTFHAAENQARGTSHGTFLLMFVTFSGSG